MASQVDMPSPLPRTLFHVISPRKYIPEEDVGECAGFGVGGRLRS